MTTEDAASKQHDARDRDRDGRVSRGETLYDHVRHPWAAERHEAGPVKVADQHDTGTAVARFNARVANLITAVVGTMWAFYVFNGIALVSLPTAIRTGNPQVIVNWASSNWIQLILLPALMVGQALQGRAADARAEQTFQDAEAILHECLELQRHLKEQDSILAHVPDLKTLVADLHGQLSPPAPPSEGTPS